MPQDTSLVNLLVDQERHISLKQLLSSLPDITLNLRQICDFELLTTGVFSPLKGFMTQEAYESVLDRMRLPSGEIWPVPICLDVSRIFQTGLRPDSPLCFVTLKDFP